MNKNSAFFVNIIKMKDRRLIIIIIINHYSLVLYIVNDSNRILDIDNGI